MLTPTIQLELPRPPSANRYWRHAVIKGHLTIYVSAEAKKYRAAVAAECQRLQVQPIDGPVSVEIHAWLCDARADLGNIEKVLSDSLNTHAWGDDKQLVEIHLYRHKAPHRVDEHVTVTVKAASTYDPATIRG